MPLVPSVTSSFTSGASKQKEIHTPERAAGNKQQRERKDSRPGLLTRAFTALWFLAPVGAASTYLADATVAEAGNPAGLIHSNE